jgi:iron complex outermembrane receptor protein
VRARWLASAALLACLLFAPAALRAQQAQDPQGGAEPIEEITVWGRKDSLIVPSLEDARAGLERIPGGVDLVEAEEFRGGRAVTLKDVLDYVPGVFVQPKWGEDARLSIRGSGLSRNFHLRGVRLLVDGVPINTSDGSGDFQEIDPLWARYVEVYKGANALQHGASYLGGAVNLVMPSGRDADRFLGRFEGGSFDYARGQVASGAARGRWDYFATGTLVQQDGFRDHSAGDAARLAANLGYRFSETAETRFYLHYNHVEQQIPGAVRRDQALDDPERAALGNLAGDYHRDMESVRLSNQTTLALDPDTRLKFGAYGFSKHLYHPIFQVIDYRYDDLGAFARLEHATELAGRGTELVAGLNLGGGNTDARRFVNARGGKGRPTADAEERALTAESYGEARVRLIPELSAIAGLHLTHAARSIHDRFRADGNDSDRRTYTELGPRVGLLWEPVSSWQVFANLSRSAEVPTFSELNPTAAPGFARLDAQRAITAELGTRGRREAIAWDVALYHARLRDELQLFDAGGGATFARNADRTVHQGAEVGLQLRLLQGLVARGAGADALWLRQAYTYSDFHFDGDPVFGDNDLPGAPRHYYRAELSYEHPLGIELGVNVEWVPQSYPVDNANTLDTDDHALLGARLRAPLPGGVALFVDARNLTDRRYIASASVATRATPASALFEPGSGRAVYVGVELRR